MADDLGSELEALRAQVARLQSQVAKVKPRAVVVEFLGEEISADLLAELAVGGKLSAAETRKPRQGMRCDGRNLWLQVTPGGRSWVFRYRWGPKQRDMGLGSLDAVTLAEARARAAICRRLLREGVDPIERRRALTAATSANTKASTFRQAAARYIKAHAPTWKNEKHAAQWPATLEAYVYPFIGDLPVKDVDTDRVLKILEPIWSTKPETAARVRGRVEAVLDWATARGMRHGENPARWKGHVQKLLPPRSKVRTVKHHAALAYGDMHGFWTSLDGKVGASVEALRFAILTAARTGEVIGATWAEIDLAAKVWTVPGQRMKAGKEHRVPLSAEALAVLARVAPFKKAEHSFVFPGAKDGKPLSSMAMLMMLRKMGRDDLTAHGFRSTFRDWAAETTAYPSDMVEMALAHTVGNKVEAAYRRGDMFDRRRRLMDDWTTHCTTAPTVGDNVVSIGAGR